MTERATEAAPLPGLRRIPRQSRSMARVDAVITALVELVSDESVDPSLLTTGDVAAAAGVPIGSLYEYFEDLAGIVDAAVAGMLRHHDALLAELGTTLPTDREALIDVLLHTYARLYEEAPGFVALRNSTLFQPRHRRALNATVDAFVARVADAGVAQGLFVDRTDTTKRLSLVFSLGDAILQQQYRDGGGADPAIVEEGRAILRLAVERLAP